MCAIYTHCSESISFVIFFAFYFFEAWLLQGVSIGYHFMIPS